MKATTVRVYDFDPAWDVPDGEDDKGVYVIRAIQTIYKDGSICLTNGLHTDTYKIVKEAVP